MLRHESGPAGPTGEGDDLIMEPKRVQYRNFNLIRLLAALQVLLVHGVNHFEYATWFGKALKAVPGVPAFFFTSGFLIYFAYQRMEARDKRGFYINRLLRIYPGLLACVALSVLSVYLTGYFGGRNIGFVEFWAWIAGQSTIFQFYNPPFMRDYGVGVLNGALWTISVEMQFYFLVPILFWLLHRHRFALAAICAFSVIVNVAANLYLRQPGAWDQLYMKLLMVSFLPYIFMFILGFFMASSARARQLVDRVPLLVLLITYALTMNFVGSYNANASNSINPISFLILALIIMKLSKIPLPLRERVRAFFERTDFSYGLYLYHMPIINLLLVLAWFSPVANLAVLILAGFFAAAASWYLIESPVLAHKR
jgi:peptidoglycan/LPS O-acetylase OafA/YrhL